MVETYRLNTGINIPRIGFGTYQVAPDHTASAVSTALRAGYRLIDTAQFYNNEQGVGQALRDSEIDRKGIFVTTKLLSSDLGYQSAIDALDVSLSKLGLDYVDLYLIHWPAPFGSGDTETNRQLRHETWRAFEEVYKSGHARNIGVSNFVVRHLEELLTYAKVIPAINQIELHPFIFEEQRPIVEFCQKYEIVVEAYSPLSRGGHLNHPVVSQIAQAHGKTNAQILIRWALQHDTVPLPRSISQAHIEENLDVFDFELTPDEVRKLNRLTDRSARVAPDPHHIK